MTVPFFLSFFLFIPPLRENPKEGAGHGNVTNFKGACFQKFTLAFDMAAFAISSSCHFKGEQAARESFEGENFETGIKRDQGNALWGEREAMWEPLGNHLETTRGWV